MRFRLFCSLLFALLLALPFTVAAEESADELFADLRLELYNLNPAWWEGYSTASAADKQRFFNALDAELARILVNSLQDSTEGKLIPQLAKTLAASSTKVIEAPSLPEVKARYSLDEWLVILRAYRSFNQQQSELKQSLQDTAGAVAGLKKELANLLLRYRELSAQDAKKAPLALSIIQRQLELLIAQSQEGLFKKQLTLIGDAQSASKQLADAAVDQLDGSKEQYQTLQQQVDAYRSQLASLSGAHTQSRVTQLQQDNPENTLPALVEQLNLEARIISTQVRLAAAHLQAQILTFVEAAPARISAEQDTALPEPALSGLASRISQHRNAVNKAQDKILTASALSGPQSYQLLTELQQSRVQLDQSNSLLQETLLLEAYAKQLQRDQQSWWERATSLSTQAWQGSGALIIGWLNYPLFSINESPVSFNNILWVFLIITLAIFISQQFRRLLKRIGAAQQSFSEAAIFTISKILHYIIMVVAIIIGLSSIGLDLSNLAIVAGALSLGIGFGLQSIFNNFISGLILLFERPFSMGDLVELESGVRGRIRSINVRSTHINTWDNVDVLVPNSEFIGGRVTNYTLADDVRRLHINFGVAYGSDKEIVRQAALEAANAVKHTLHESKREPDLWLVNFGDSSLDFELIVWIHHNLLPPGHNPKTDYLWALETALTRYGIEIPFPQRDLHIRSMDDKILSATPLSQGIEPKETHA